MRRITFIAFLISALLGAALAAAESEQIGKLRISFDARFSPHSLPRHRPAPVTIDLSGAVRTADGSRPPQLRRISIAINRHGRLFTRGLPVCPKGRLESTSSKLALKRCRRSLIGRGQFGATVDLPDLSPFPVDGRMLAFHGRDNGRPEIYLHIHGSTPVEATVVLDFRVRRLRRGRYGTLLTTKIPLIASDLGYVTDVALSFHRRYRFRGKARSVLSARCAAPQGFPGAIFPFARGRFDFADGKTFTTTLVRDCLVR